MNKKYINKIIGILIYDDKIKVRFIKFSGNKYVINIIIFYGYFF